MVPGAIGSEREPARAASVSRAIAIGAAVLAVAVVPAVSVWGGAFSVDEFGFLHIAWCVSRGQRLYLDFFEHHTPLLAYALQLPLAIFGPHFSAVYASRALMAVFKATTLAALFASLRRTHGAVAAAAAVLVVATEEVTLLWGQRIYSDVPAATALVLSAWAVQRSEGPRSRAWAAIAGALLAAAPLFNLKAVFPGLGLLLGSVLVLARGAEPRRHVAIFFASGIAVVVAVALLVGPATWPAFWKYVVVFSARFSVHQSVVPHVVASFRANPTFWLASLAGMGIWLARLGRSGIDARTDLLAAGAVFAIVGAFAIPTVWDEYLVETLPLLGVWVAQAALSLETRLATSRRPRLERLAVLVAATAIAAWFLRDAPARIGATAGVAIACALFLFSRRLGPSDRTLGVVGVLAVAFALLPLPALARQPNARTVRRHAFVDRLVPPDEYVFDGFSGLGVFRPHPYFYWITEIEVQEQLLAGELGPDVVAALAAHPPKLVVWTEDFDALPPEVHDWVRARYAPLPNRPRLWVRR